MPATSQTRSAAHAVGFLAGSAVPKGIDQGPRAEVIPRQNPGMTGRPGR